MPKITPWSSVGASSLGDMRYMGTASTPTRIQMPYTAGRWRRVASSSRP